MFLLSNNEHDLKLLDYSFPIMKSFCTSLLLLISFEVKENSKIIAFLGRQQGIAIHDEADGLILIEKMSCIHLRMNK